MDQQHRVLIVDTLARLDDSLNDLRRLRKARVSDRSKGELNFVLFNVKGHLIPNAPNLDTNALN